MSYKQFSEKYSIKLNILTYHAIIRSVKNFQQSLGIINEETNEILNKQFFLTPFTKIIKGCSEIYKQLNERAAMPNGLHKWQTKFANLTDWSSLFVNILSLTKDTKLHWFQ